LLLPPKNPTICSSGSPYFRINWGLGSSFLAGTAKFFIELYDTATNNENKITIMHHLSFHIWSKNDIWNNFRSYVKLPFFQKGKE
jgi:hypothetical protein